MKQNVGPREKIFRIGLGAMAIGAAFLVPKARAWRWVLAGWGLANLTTGIVRYCPSNQLTGIDNTAGDEFVHFDESLGGVRGRIGHRLNDLQHRIGATT